MKVRDVMRTGELATVGPEDSVALAAQIMSWSGVRHLPVLREGEVVGIISERDLLRRGSAVGAKQAAREPVERVMSAPAITMDPDKPLVAAVWLMSSRKLGCLPVVGPGGLCGIVTTADIVRHQFETELAELSAAGPLA
jgi:CBS domain-containing protein